MKEIHLKYNDHELFGTNFTPEHYNFIYTHMDAFKHMWNEQTKSFWCKHLTMYRHYCYNIGTVHHVHHDLNPKNMSSECLSVLADKIFVVLYDEFVGCRWGTAKELINDIKTYLINRDLTLACWSTSIRNNPFCMVETRDVFRKLVGCCRSYPNGLKEIFLHCLAYPIYGIFGGSIYHLLKRWLNAKEISSDKEIYLENCWVCPPELQSPSFVPLPYHRHLLKKNGDQVDMLLFTGCFGLFSSHRMSPDGNFVQKENEGLDLSGSSSHVFETYIEFMSTREWIPGDKYDLEDVCCDFNDYLREKVEDFEDEELRRTVILKLAEKKFEEELEEEKKQSHAGNKSKEKKLMKQGNNIQNSFCKNGVQTSPPKDHASSSNQPSATASIIKGSDDSGSDKKQLSNKNKTGTDNITKSNSVNGPKELPDDGGLKAKLSRAYVGMKKEPSTIYEETKSQVSDSVTSNTLPTSDKKSRKKKKKKKGGSESGLLSLANGDSNGDTCNSANTKCTLESQNKNSDTIETEQTRKINNSKSKFENEKGTIGKVKANNSLSGLVNPVLGKVYDGKEELKGKTSTMDSRTSVTTTAKGTTAELVKIKKNIDTIKNTVEEQNELSLDGFRLMVETGSLLMSGNQKDDAQKPSVQSCAQCRKTEDKPKSFKKCARCKAENVKWVRYYCSRECQAENWVQCHQDEHQKNLLVKK